MKKTIEWSCGDPVSRFFVAVAAKTPLPGDAPEPQELLELGVHHGLLGMLAGSGVSELAEPVVYHHLAQRLRQRAMLVHLRRVLTKYHDAGIPATVLKGPYVAAAYENPDFRTFTDLDLLVPEQSLETALSILADDEAVRTIPPKFPKADKRDIPLYDPSGAMFNLDLHWDLFSYTQLLGSADMATHWAWEHAAVDPGHELGPLWNLPPGPRICFLSTHALLDHRFRLILFRDIVELARRGVDWDAVVKFAAEFHLRSTTYVSLLIAKRLLAAEVSEAVLDELRPRGPLINLIEGLLPRTDFVRFDGHKPNLLNLAVVLLHDQPRKQAALVARAPLAAPDWLRRVQWSPLARTQSRSRRAPTPTVTVLVSSTRRRGAEVFGERLASGLGGLGWQAILTCLTGEDGGAVIAGKAVSNRSPDDLGRLDLNVVRGLRTELNRQRPAVIFANGSSTLQYSIVASFGLRPRPLLVYSAIGESRYWTKGLKQRLAQKVLLAKTDHIIAVSEESQRQLTEFMGIPPEKVSVAHTGVPAAFFEVEPLPAADHLRLLYLGNLSREKDPRTALRIYKKVRDIGCDARLRFVGGGPLLDRLRDTARDLAISGAELMGAVDDVRPHLAWADLLMVTSETEGLPGAILEAAAAGVPAVAFDVGGVRETMEAGETGILIPNRDPELFARTVASLCGDKAALKEMGKRAKQFAEDRFIITHAIERYNDILGSLLARADGRRLLRHVPARD